MNPKQQTDAFVTALLNHCSALQVMVLRNPGKPDEAPSSVHPLNSQADLERLRGWLWYENASRSGQVYVRPAPSEDHPWIFLDDVPRPLAEGIAREYGALVVETTPGNCQIRMLAEHPLPEDERTDIQRDLAERVGADPGSVAGSKWGRLPGYRNKKPGRDGCWTNLLLDTTATAPRYVVVPPPPVETGEPGGRGIPDHCHATAIHGSGEADGEGGYVSEFSFACNCLRDGWPEHAIISAIAQHALERGKRRTLPQARKYAEVTVRKAAAKLRRR